MWARKPFFLSQPLVKVLLSSPVSESEKNLSNEIIDWRPVNEPILKGSANIKTWAIQKLLFTKSTILALESINAFNLPMPNTSAMMNGLFTGEAVVDHVSRGWWFLPARIWVRVVTRDVAEVIAIKALQFVSRRVTFERHLFELWSFCSRRKETGHGTIKNGKLIYQSFASIFASLSSVVVVGLEDRRFTDTFQAVHLDE